MTTVGSSWTEKYTEQVSPYTAKCSTRLALIGGAVAYTWDENTHTHKVVG